MCLILNFEPPALNTLNQERGHWKNKENLKVLLQVAPPKAAEPPASEKEVLFKEETESSRRARRDVR